MYAAKRSIVRDYNIGSDIYHKCSYLLFDSVFGTIIWKQISVKIKINVSLKPDCLFNQFYAVVDPVQASFRYSMCSASWE